MNPWILPIKFFVLQLDGQGELELKTKEYVSPVDVDLNLSYITIRDQILNTRPI